MVPFKGGMMKFKISIILKLQFWGNNSISNCTKILLEEWKPILTVSGVRLCPEYVNMMISNMYCT